MLIEVCTQDAIREKDLMRISYSTRHQHPQSGTREQVHQATEFYRKQKRFSHTRFFKRNVSQHKTTEKAQSLVRHRHCILTSNTYLF